MFRNFYIFILLMFFTFAVTSCREEIITPGNIAGNINEPVKMQSATSYSFVVNAEDISTNVTDISPFMALRSSCYITILDYSSGNVQITITGRANTTIYSNIFASNNTAVPLIFEGNSPQYIQLRFYNFTGKLRFELNKL